MSVPAPSTPHGLGRRDLDLVFVARHLTLVVYMITTYVGRADLPWWEPVSDFGLILPYSLLCHHLARRRNEVPGWVPFVDVLACVTWLYVQPELGLPLTALLVTTLTLNGLATPPRWLWAAFGVATIGVVSAPGVEGATASFIAGLRFAVVGGGPLFAIGVVRRAFLRTEGLLRHRSLHDQLTNLANRELFGQALDEAARRGPVAVLLIDLDNFKEINDALGHHVGDRVLIEVASRLADPCRDTGLAARLGGDEFALLLPDLDHRGAVAWADRIAASITRPVEVDGLALEVGSSIGIALAPEHGSTAEELLQRADVSMYQAKRAGRPFRVYDPGSDPSSVRRITLLGELRGAISGEQMEIWYQPVLDLALDRFVAVEALVRWRHPRHGLLLPGEFIELAEISGAIDDLTRWVVERSLDDLAVLDRSGHRLSMAANLSVRNLHDPELLEWITGLTRTTAAATSRLHLELTESQLMEDPTAARQVLRHLAELGIGCSIDDFGTGYSSMSLLRHVQATELKIDRSFVTDLLTEPESDILVTSMIELGHHLGMAVVAEGVEDTAVLGRLRSLGCDLAQGYALSPPLPLGDLLGFLGTAGPGSTETGAVTPGASRR